MTSGYISLIEDGKITNPKDFLKVCLRAFGIMNREREEKLSLESVENVDFSLTNNSTYNYYKDSLEKDIKMLKDIEDKSDNSVETWNKAYEEFVRYYEEQLAQTMDSKTKCIERNNKFDSFIDAISKWDCSKDYIPVKDFAISQLNSCKDDTDFYDKTIKHYKDILEHPVENFKKYMNSEIECLRETIKRHEESLFKCIEENKNKREFYNGFMSEVENMELSN